MENGLVCQYSTPLQAQPRRLMRNGLILRADLV